MSRLSTTEELASKLPINLHYLSTLIARKPLEFTNEWGSTIDEAFSLYTRTRTVDLILRWNDILIEKGWPFPSYVNIREEVGIYPGSISRLKLLRSLLFTGKQFLQPLIFYTDSEKNTKTLDNYMRLIFWHHSKQIFKFWRSHHLLKGQESIIDSIRVTYNKRLYAACLPTLIGLLDFVMRAYFHTNHLKTSLQTLRNAFEKAGLLPKHLKPGSGIWDLKKESESTILFSSVEQDLRLPGILLSSFVEFGNVYYAWYSTANPNNGILNRHAITHCATEYWTPINAVKLLTFFDLTLRLEKVLKIVIHGQEADEKDK